MNAPQLLTTAQAAKHLGIKAQTMRVWRGRGSGPEYVRIGQGRFARAAYTIDSINAWIAARTFSSTSDETVRSTAAPAA